MDVPSTSAGDVISIEVAAGDRVNEGDVFARLRVAESAADEADPVDDVETPDDQSSAPDTSDATDTPDAAPPAAGSPAEIEVRVPDIGDFSRRRCH